MSIEIWEKHLRAIIEKMLTANPVDRMSSSDVVQQLLHQNHEIWVQLVRKFYYYK
jgi:hypothetical protein